MAFLCDRVCELLALLSVEVDIWFSPGQSAFSAGVNEVASTTLVVPDLRLLRPSGELPAQRERQRILGAQ